MGRHLHIIQCKTIELSIHLKMETVRRSFAVVIAFPQLKCMNVAASKNSSRARARSQAVAMFTRLLLKLAGPVPPLKKRAAVRRCWILQGIR